MRHTTPNRHFIKRTQVGRRKGKQENTTMAKKNYSGTAEPVKEEDNRLNMRNSWYEHDRKR